MNGNWGFNFTQEWPVVSQAHQFSYTVSALDNGDGAGVGDTLLNYRYQALTEGPGRPAFSPRVSLVLPTGDVPSPPRLGISGPADQPAVQQADRRLVLALERRLHVAAEGRGVSGAESCRRSAG